MTQSNSPSVARIDHPVPGFTTIVMDAAQQFPEVPLEQVSHPSSVAQALELFLQESEMSDSSSKGIQSVCYRHLVPALGGPSSSRARLNTQEIKHAKTFLADLPLTELVNATEKLERYIQQIKLPKSTQENVRSKFKKFDQWVQQQAWFNITENSTEFEPVVIYRHGQGAPPNRSRRGRSFGNQMFGRNLEHYQVVGEPMIPSGWQKRCLDAALINQFCPRLSLTLLWIMLNMIEPKLVLGNQELEQDFLHFYEFMQRRCNRSFATLERDVHELLRALDWVFETEKIPLTKLSLQNLVEAPSLPKMLQIKTFRERYPDDVYKINAEFMLAKNLADEILDEAVRSSRQRLERYLDFKDVQHESQVNCTKTWINLARYFYADQTKDFKSERGFRDVPVICAFRQLANNHTDLAISSGEKTRSKQSKRERMIPWPIIYLAPNLAFEKYEQKNIIQVTRTQRYRRADGSPRVQQVPRSQLAIARDLKRALILGIATALPPGRSKVYYGLELGKTLLHGCFNQTGTSFTPYEHLSPTEQKNALWWIDLTPADGKRKTITVGGWTCHIPNRNFSTGKTLYDYMDEWLTWARPLLGKNPSHNYFFSQENGLPFTTSVYGTSFERAIAQFTGYVGIYPHLLRSILATYALGQNITDAERRSLAKMQRHSEEQQQRNYTEIPLFQELQPALKMMERFDAEITEIYQLKTAPNSEATAELCLKDDLDLDPDVIDLLSLNQLHDYILRKRRKAP